MITAPTTAQAQTVADELRIDGYQMQANTVDALTRDRDELALRAKSQTPAPLQLSIARAESDALTARVAELESALEFLLGELDGLEGTIGTFTADWAQVARDQARAALAKEQP